MFTEEYKNRALDFIRKNLKSEKAFEGVEPRDIDNLTAKIMEKDMEFMEENKVHEGEIYDEDLAYDYIYDKLSQNTDVETKALISLVTDGYLQYFGEFLDKDD